MRQAVPERKAKASTRARRLRPGLVTPASGGVGAPPGGTLASREELADVDVRSFAVADARLWNGADTVARSLRRLKQGAPARSRNARPDAVNLPPAVDRIARDIRENAAMERRKARRFPVNG